MSGVAGVVVLLRVGVAAQMSGLVFVDVPRPTSAEASMCLRSAAGRARAGARLTSPGRQQPGLVSRHRCEAQGAV